MSSAPSVPTAQSQLAEKVTAGLKATVSSETIVRASEPLAGRTTLRVGGPADVFVQPANEADLAAILRFCSKDCLPVFVLGRGSNLLVRDGGIRGVVIHLGAGFSRVRVTGTILDCGGGARLKAVAHAARDNNLAGLEFLEGIPGTLGGALRMNAGAMGSSIFDVVGTVRYMDRTGAMHEAPASGMHATYRRCEMLRDNIALGATLHGAVCARDQVQARMEGFSRRRWASQPAAPSAGCMFKNPEAVPAGKLIDELGLKGTRVGGAVVSSEHGNFIVNDQRATARDVLGLIEQIRSRVQELRGISLETEVEITGEE